MLEDHIKNNRDQLDTENPPPGIWDRIEKELDQQERGASPATWFLRVAAAIVFAFGCWFAYDAMQQPASQGIADNQGVDSVQVQEDSLQALPLEVEEAGVYYVSRISETLEDITKLDKDVSADLALELKELENDFDALSEDMGQPVNREQVLEAMIRNYRMKLNLLEEVLRELRHRQNETKDEEPKNL
ncbi:MAG: anti-sigma factor [Flavobacteriales bacterium]|nr:anti-sigma factor [Flavobacteriales bacterium]